MTTVEQLASFAIAADFEDLSDDTVAALKVRILDALGCALGALDDQPIRALAGLVTELGGAPRATLIGLGAASAPDRAALYNGALVRELDFNDSYLAPGETCHPSDNLAGLLALAEDAHASGADLLAALAVAYQVQTRLSDEAPVRARGFDHTTQLAYSAAAGGARVAGLDPARAAHAIAIAGTHLNALRVTRTGALSHWKGLAAPAAAAGATHAVLLARHGITGPAEVFEGNKGFMDTIAGPFDIAWDHERLDGVTRTILKKHNAEIHSQTAIDVLLELREAHDLAADAVDHIDLEVFDVAYHIIGGGAEGDKTTVTTKEEADHSLPYLLAVALTDGEVTPAQFTPSRIAAPDVQALLHRVTVRAATDLSARFPDEHPCRLIVHLRDGSVLLGAGRDYEGFTTRPAGWDTVRAKFDRLAAPHADADLRDDIAAAVNHLEAIDVAELTAVLARVPDPRHHAAAA